MAIIRRTIRKAPETIQPEQLPDIEVKPLTKVQVEENRITAYVNGNAGKTPHPKSEPPEVLLAMVQVVQNPDTDFGRQEEFYRNRIRSPLTGIRAFCVMCEGGSQASSNCIATQCPLWPYRKGKNAMFGKLKDKEIKALEEEAE